MPFIGGNPNPATTINIADLDDIGTLTPVDRQLLTFDQTSSKWVNTTARLTRPVLDQLGYPRDSVETFPRLDSGSGPLTLAGGNIFSYSVVPYENVTVSTIALTSSEGNGFLWKGTFDFGIYDWSTSSPGVLIASSGPAQQAVANSAIARPMTAPVTLNAGQEYYFAVLAVVNAALPGTSTTFPSTRGRSVWLDSTTTTKFLRTGGPIAGTTLPATFPVAPYVFGTANASLSMPYMRGY